MTFHPLTDAEQAEYQRLLRDRYAPPPAPARHSFGSMEMAASFVAGAVLTWAAIMIWALA